VPVLPSCPEFSDLERDPITSAACGEWTRRTIAGIGGLLCSLCVRRIVSTHYGMCDTLERTSSMTEGQEMGSVEGEDGDEWQMWGG
jgi:hypothetical protein